MVMAQDDTLAGRMILAFYDALKAAGHRPEFHIFSSGGHGWGMRKQGKTPIAGSTESVSGWNRRV